MSSITRRDFINTTVGASAGGMLLGLQGCGGGSDATGTKPTTPETPGTPLTTTARAAAINSVSTFFDTLPHTSADSDNQQLLAFLKSNSAFKAAGSVRSGSLWATFQDDTSLCIVNDGSVNGTEVVHAMSPSSRVGSEPVMHVRRSDARLRTPASVASQLSVPPDLLPTGKKVVLCNTMGLFATKIDPETAASNSLLCVLTAAAFLRLQLELVQIGYDVSIIDGSVPAMRGIKSTDVLYMYGHLGYVVLPDQTEVVALSSSDPIVSNLVLDPLRYGLYLSDILAGRVGYMMYTQHAANTPGSPQTLKSYYYITNKFILEYMNFTQRSLVFVNGCESYCDEAKSLSEAFKTKDAGVFVGWDKPVNAGEALDSGQFLFETLSGVSNLYKPSPPLRAFPYPAAATLLKSRIRDGLRWPYDSSIGANGPSQLQLVLLRPPASDQLGLLAPSIYALAPGGTTLSIYGTFGDEQGTVTITGVNVAVQSWTRDLIKCDLPAADKPGGTGLVQVFSGQGIRSNGVYLTLWKLKFHYTATYDGSKGTTPSDTLSGSYTVSATLEVPLRGDVHPARATPLDDPLAVDFAPQVEGASYPNALAKLTDYSIAGTITHAVKTGDINNPVIKTVTETAKVDGSGPWVYDETNANIQHQQGVLSVIVRSVRLNPWSMQLSLRAVLPTYTTTLSPNTVLGVSPYSSVISSRGISPGSGNTVSLSFDPLGNISAGSMDPGDQQTLSWEAVAPEAGTGPNWSSGS